MRRTGELRNSCVVLSLVVYCCVVLCRVVYGCVVLCT